MTSGNTPPGTYFGVGTLRTDPRLSGYLVAGFGALIAAVATGRPELAALAAPFLAIAAKGLVNRRPPELDGEVRLETLRVIEGDCIEGKVLINWDGEAEIDVLLADWKGVTPIAPSPVIAWSLPRTTGPAALPFKFTARSWGIHSLGTLRVRLRRPGSLLSWERRLTPAPRLRVLPTLLRVDRLLKPAEPRAAAGSHLSRSRGHGTDFAELRPYRPGDRLRDLSWAASARSGEPWVTVHHPERTGTVLILLDAFFRSEQESTEVLARAARAAWAIASVHLRAQDRVGLIAHGRAATWLAPSGGRRARLQLLDELLAVGGAAEDQRQNLRPRGRVVVPSDALVVGVTSLGSPMFNTNLLRYRRMGHTTVALVIDTTDLLPSGVDTVDLVARRIWTAQQDAERHTLHRGGVATALVTGPVGVGAAISTLRRRMNALPSTNPVRIPI